MCGVLALGICLGSTCTLLGQVCRVSASGLNRNRKVTGAIHAECPSPIHTAPFGNWGVTSNFGQKVNGHQFQGWCHNTPICDNRGNCRTECRDGWYEWNSCTDIDQFKAPNCTLYNDKDCTAQASTTGLNIHGTRSIDVAVRCPSDTNADGVSDEGGCADVKTFSNGTNFMSLYELDPGTGDELVQTIYFPQTAVSLRCTVFGCEPAQSDWVSPSFFDSPATPGKVFAELSFSVNSAVFVDTSRACRAVGPAFAAVPAASFTGQVVAPESIVALFGSGLSPSAADATILPLPLELNGTRVSITDSAGATRSAPLFYVAPNQINLQIPPGTAAGPAQMVATRTDTVMSRGSVQIAPVAPDLFTANANGQGVAAASALRINSGGIAVAVPVFHCGSEPLSCAATPIDLGLGPVYLTLYGTGFRGAARTDVTVTIGGLNAELLFSGAQPQFTGLDQINVVIPAALRGRGMVDIRVVAGSRTSNAVTLAIQ
jgi:uncharacterized protein (TIGR03437 family)